MTEHYYTNQPSTEHDFSTFSSELRGKKFTFLTDSGVFSKHRVDYGSQVLIETFDPSILPSGTLLDVGCGYGPMGLSFASEVSQVEMIDVNECSVALAKENALKNRITNAHIHVSYLYDNLLEKEYAGIISNPPVRAGKKVVTEILTSSFSLLKKGGALTIVLQKKQGAPSAEKTMKDTFGNVEILKRDKGYYILQSIKME